MAFKSYDLSEWHGMCGFGRHVCQYHTEGDIHSDHSYSDTLGIPLNSTLIERHINGQECYLATNNYDIYIQ